uniref:IMD domain-containing protein n=1 Tax=Heterorhabditis bacteriophora TaxID=37862 RepID=A0A1I7X7X3_HETBA
MFCFNLKEKVVFMRRFPVNERYGRIVESARTCYDKIISDVTKQYTMLLAEAGNLFKMAKLWKEAGDAFVKAAELHGSKEDLK